MEINLKLDLDEVNGIIAVLATLPFNQVVELMGKVREQTIEQIKNIESNQEDSQ